LAFFHTGLWIEIEGPHMKQIDTGMTSKVWAVDDNGETFSLGSDQKWKKMNFRLSHVSAGGSGKFVSLINKKRIKWALKLRPKG
jgi:hypothetical protein